MKATQQTLRTKQQAREWLLAHGITQVDLAKSLGVDVQAVKDVLRLRGDGRKGHFGDAHKVAVALGMKAAPEGESPLNMAVSHRAKRAAKPQPETIHEAA